MKNFKIVVLVILTIILCLTIYDYGKVKYYFYENSEKPGWGHYLKTYEGENLGKFYKNTGEKYKYDSVRYRLEKDPEVRTIIIVLIVAVSFFFFFKIIKS